MEKIEAKLKELEDEVTQVKIQMNTKDRGLEEKKKAIVDYMEKEFATHKLVMQEIVEGAKAEFSAQRINLHTLYEATTKEIVAMKDRLEEVEKRGTQNSKGKKIAAKHMIPRTLDKQE